MITVLPDEKTVIMKISILIFHILYDNRLKFIPNYISSYNFFNIPKFRIKKHIEIES